MIKAFIFDLDGVIVDTAKYHFSAWRRMANELGFDFTEKENEQLKGVSRVDSINLILGWGGKTLSEADKVKWAAQKNEWYLEYLNQMTPAEILPGVLPLLKDLRKKGYKIALGSSSKNAERALRKVRIFSYFNTINEKVSKAR